MKMQEKLISGMQAAFPGESQASLARRAGLSVQRFNNYVTGIRTMDVDAVIGCAQALGWDIRATVAEHEIETAPTPRVKAYWRKLAGTAAMLLCAIGLAIGAPPKALAHKAFSDQSAKNEVRDAGECLLCKVGLGLVGAAAPGLAGMALAWL